MTQHFNIPQQPPAPPIPDQLTLTSTIGPGAFNYPFQLTAVGMMDWEEYQHQDWQALVGKRTGAPGAGNVNSGFRTAGISTCVGIAIVLTGVDNAGQAQCQLSLAHLSNRVALHQAALNEIFAYLLACPWQPQAATYYIAFGAGNEDQAGIWANVTNTFAANNIPMNDAVIEFLDTLSPARLAVNLGPQGGTWVG